MSSALYAHKVNTLFWHDVDDATCFGFAKHQVTPFHLHSSGETLYAWHVLPLDVYARNEVALRKEDRPEPVVEDITSRMAFKLLQSPDARVVVSCTSLLRPINLASFTVLTAHFERSPRQRRPHRSRLADGYISLPLHATQHARFDHRLPRLRQIQRLAYRSWTHCRWRCAR